MKKVLSLVLSLCLFVSLGAGISFDVAEAAAATTYYDLTLPSSGDTGATKADWQNFVAGLTYDVVNSYDTANTSGDWSFHSNVRLNQSGGADNGSGNNYLGYVSGEGHGITLTQDNNKFNKDALYFNFKVEAAGKYVPQFVFDNHSGQPRHGMVRLVVFNKNSDGSIGSEIASKWVNTANYNFGARENVSDTAIEFAAGEYIFGWEIYQSRSNGTVAGFNMVAADSATPVSLQLGVGEGLYTVRKGEKIEVPISGKLSTGADLAVATSNGWQNAADTANVHTRLNKSNGTLDITGLEVTSSNETFYVKLGEAIRYFNVKVVDADYVAPDKNYTYNFLKNMGSDAKIRGGNALLHSMNPWTTPYATTTAGAYGETRNSYTSDPWAVLSKKNASGVETANMYFARSEQAIGAYFYDAGTVEIGVLVATDGMYTPTATLHSTAPACDFDIAFKTMDGTTLATKTFASGANAGATVALTDAAVELKAGEYKFVLSKTTKNAMCYINALGLTYAGGLDYNVTLNANGGEIAEEIPTYTHGYATTLPAVTAPAGYEFGGWYDNADFDGTAVTEIPATARGDKEYFAKITKKVYATADDFEVSASSGYYAYYVSNPNREGVIAISATFAKYATVAIEKAGVMIYVAGNEENPSKIAKIEASAAEIAADPNFAGTVNAIFDGIAKENFDKEVLAKAYVVIEGEYIYSDVVVTGVDSTRWVGVKPE